MVAYHVETADTEGRDGRTGWSNSSTVGRREFVSTITVAGLMGLAGCLGDDGQEDEDDVDEEDEDDVDEEDEDDVGEEDVEPTLEVETNDATDVGETTATLTGELVTIDGLEEATLTFEYGLAEEELETSVDVETRSSTGVFEADVDGLAPDTAYEFRAVAAASDLVAEGGTESFTTAEAEPDYTVVVDGTSFEPAELTITVGETVEWVFEGSGHNVFVSEAPEESEWDGTEGHDTFSAGHVHQHTFQVPGTYEYYCQPHSHLDMEGTVVVES